MSSFRMPARTDYGSPGCNSQLRVNYAFLDHKKYVAPKVAYFLWLRNASNTRPLGERKKVKTASGIRCTANEGNLPMQAMIAIVKFQGRGTWLSRFTPHIGFSCYQYVRCYESSFMMLTLYYVTQLCYIFYSYLQQKHKTWNTKKILLHSCVASSLW